MNTVEQESILSGIPADRKIIDILYAHGQINRDGRDYALQMLYPHNKWGLWVSRLLLIIGAVLILSGFVFFFAYNWNEITPMVKLGSIELLMISCLVGAYYYSLERISGQVLLLAASIMVGIFMAVFGQIYQTGADAYQLFMMWSLLTLGWTIISSFAAQWTFWLVISNIALLLWWTQTAPTTREMEFMISGYLVLFNGFFLVLREYAALKSIDWLQQRWTRIFLIIGVLVVMAFPLLALISSVGRTTLSIQICGALGLLGHILAYVVYRYKLFDIWALSSVVLSMTIIVNFGVAKILMDNSFWRADAIMLLLTGLATIGIFAIALVYLRKVTKIMEVENV